VKFHPLLLSIFCLISTTGLAQYEDVFGPKANGMAGSSLTESNAWASLNNPAASLSDSGLQVAASYNNNFLLRELGTSSLAASFIRKNLSFGMGMSSFGYSAFRQNLFLASLGMRLEDNFSLGVQLGVRHFRIGEGYGSAIIPSVGIGLYVRISENLSLGALLRDPFNLGIDVEELDRIPPLMRTGLSYRFSEELRANVELEKVIDQQVRLRSGFDYQHSNGFSFRAGVLTNPFEYSLGAGYKRSLVRFDLAYIYHPLLGFSPQVGMNLQF
jgi:hypothetical protein